MGAKTARLSGVNRKWSTDCQDDAIWPKWCGELPMPHNVSTLEWRSLMNNERNSHRGLDLIPTRSAVRSGAALCGSGARINDP